MKEIKLTQGKVALVDDEDFETLNQFKWYANKIGNAFYAMRNKLDGKEKRRYSVFMHRIIMNTPKSMDTDHCDRDGLNNQKSNLRICNRQQNQRNQRQKGEFIGVSWYKYGQKWRAWITIDNKQKHLGYFEDPIVAAKARDVAAKEYFGEFANLNFTI